MRSAIAMATAGRTVVFSALTVAAAMLSLVVFPQQFLKSIGIGGAVVARGRRVGGADVLPALFTRMGTKLMPRGGVPNPAETRWARVTATVLRRPGAVAAVDGRRHGPRRGPDAARPVDRRRRRHPARLALGPRRRRPPGRRLPRGSAPTRSWSRSTRPPARATPSSATRRASRAVDGVRAGVRPACASTARRGGSTPSCPARRSAPARAGRRAGDPRRSPRPFPADVGGDAARFADGHAAIAAGLPVAAGHPRGDHDARAAVGHDRQRRSCRSRRSS